MCRCNRMTFELIIIGHTPNSRPITAACSNSLWKQILYSQKCRQELNLAVGSRIAISNLLVDLNLVVQHRIAICILYVSKKFWRILIWRLLRQSAKLPNLILHQILQLYGMTLNMYTSSLTTGEAWLPAQARMQGTLHLTQSILIASLRALFVHSIERIFYALLIMTRTMIS